MCLLINRQLVSFLRALVHQDGDGRSETGKKEDVDNLPAILAIFRTIKNAEDLVDKAKSEVSQLGLTEVLVVALCSIHFIGMV